MTTYCKHGHEWTEENTYIPPNRPEVRICRACKNKNNNAWHARRRKFIKDLKSGTLPGCDPDRI